MGCPIYTNMVFDKTIELREKLLVGVNVLVYRLIFIIQKFLFVHHDFYCD